MRTVSDIEYWHADFDMFGEFCVLYNGTGHATESHTRYYSYKKLHRRNGPAIIYTDCRFWYVDGSNYKSNKEYQEAANLSDEEMTIIVLKYGNVS